MIFVIFHYILIIITTVLDFFWQYSVYRVFVVERNSYFCPSATNLFRNSILFQFCPLSRCQTICIGISLKISHSFCCLHRYYSQSFTHTYFLLCEVQQRVNTVHTKSSSILGSRLILGHVSKFEIISDSTL